MTDTLSRILNIKKAELPLALLSVAYFFCILCGYFFLRPVREAMGVARGMDELRWLFVGTSLVSLVLVLAFGGVVARTNRRKFIPIAYLFVIACLIVFSGMLIADGAAGGDSSARIPRRPWRGMWATSSSSGSAVSICS